MTVAENIKRIRKEKGLTQKQLGLECGIAESTIRRYELGLLNPKIETIRKIATALSVHVTDLIHPYPEEPDGVSPEHPIAFPGLEKKLSEIGYYIGYGCDYAEYGDDDIWIVYPDGKKLFVSLAELEHLNLETDTYLKFRVDQLRGKKN